MFSAGNPRAVRARTAAVPALTATLRFSAAIGALLLVVPALVFAGDTGPGRIDRWVQQLVDGSAAGGWDLAHRVDWLGEPVGRTVMVLAVAALCLVAKRPALAATAVVGIGAISVLTTVLKPIVDRRIHDGFLSYPSGHAAVVTAAAMVVGLLLADLLHAGAVTGTAIVLATVVLGGGLTVWAQIALTAHYPTDALGGFGCALLVVPLTAAAIDHLVRLRTVRPTRNGGTPA
ncbi:phosphatase PAP2 family protein [Kribbella speibonae]|uniref:Phosphatase PAP2 family protein n=1 Tax=Kribbella speibonae TaxID=1572660 RepID=A0A4R0IZW3_9ACTN|nr:phosphatase PAP2 family protein [Kribbella speibonae]TCC38244.1 phosphatase PAP2 family protein [Kribbella speibonae]